MVDNWILCDVEPATFDLVWQNSSNLERTWLSLRIANDSPSKITNLLVSRLGAGAPLWLSLSLECRKPLARCLDSPGPRQLLC